MPLAKETCYTKNLAVLEMNGGPLITLSGDGLYCSLVLKKQKQKNASPLPMTGSSMPSKQMGCLFFSF